MSIFATGDWSAVAAAGVAGLFGWLSVRAQAADTHEKQLDALERRYMAALLIIRTYRLHYPDAGIPIPNEIKEDL